MRLRRQKPQPGDHLADIIVQNHPYLGWVPGEQEIGGEAAALGLVQCPQWDDDEVSSNINGSVAKLRYWPNIGAKGLVEKPRTYTGVRS